MRVQDVVVVVQQPRFWRLWEVSKRMKTQESPTINQERNPASHPSLVPDDVIADMLIVREVQAVSSSSEMASRSPFSESSKIRR